MLTSTTTTNSLCEACGAPECPEIRTSSLCEHRCCIRCLLVAAKPGASRGTALSELPPQTAIQCPVCREPSELRSWADERSEEVNLESEKAIRQKVFGLMNRMRVKFESTPAYDAYLERREEIVYTLVHSNDAEEVASLQEELQAIEAENQREIVECRQKELQLEAEEIRQIVEREGIFPELVAANYSNGFSYTPAQRAALVHVLQREYPKIFEAAAEQEAAGKASTTVDGREVLILGLKKPQPLQSSIVYDRLPAKAPTDKAAHLRACGMSRSALHTRMAQEFFAGITLKN